MAPTAPPTTAPTGPPTAAPTAAPPAAPLAAPTPVPTGCEPGSFVIGSRFSGFLSSLSVIGYLLVLRIRPGSRRDARRGNDTHASAAIRVPQTRLIDLRGFGSSPEHAKRASHARAARPSRRPTGLSAAAR